MKRFIVALVAVLFFPCAAYADLSDLYAKFGITSGDVRNYQKMTAKIPDCMVARASIPDILHPPADGPLIARAAVLHGRCRVELKAAHAPLGVMRVTDFTRSMLCVSLVMVDPDDSGIAACNMPSSLPNPNH